MLPAAGSPPLIETLNVLVSLLENARADLRGHSSMVARLTRKTCERIGLSPLQVAAFTAAAYLHDLGKMGAYHLTALNVSEYEGHRVAAGKSADLPIHLMESAGLLPETKAAIASMYERYDGQGIPDGQAGKDIPIGARILSVADTYADLTQNPRNPYRKILRPFEACEVLAPVPRHRLRPQHRRHLPAVDDRRGHARQAPQRPARGAHRRPRSGGDDGARAAPRRARASR